MEVTLDMLSKTTPPFVKCSLPRFRNARCNPLYINRGRQGRGVDERGTLTPYSFFTRHQQGSRAEAPIASPYN